MKRSKLLIILTIIITGILSASAQTKPAKQELIEKYAEQLKTTTSARDSIRILYYIFDLSDRKGQTQRAWEILKTAERADNMNAQLDMIRNLATFYAANDTVIDSLLKMTDRIPNQEARAETKSFIIKQQIKTIVR